MPVDGIIPEQVLALAAAATVFTVMFDLGLGIVIGEFRWVWRHPGLVAKALFAVIIAVPAIALAVVHAFELSRAAEIAIVLMAVSPGAPVALRRSLDAGGHRTFAPALQIMLAMLAVVSMPLWIAALNEFYGGRASIDPRELARQVFVAQLLPLGLGMVGRKLLAAAAARLQPGLARLANLLLIALTILVVIDVFGAVVDAGWRIALAIVIITACALAVGHRLGGAEPATRSAVAISSAARNPGLALLVAALNRAPPEINATILVYLVVAALTVLIYVIWRRRRATRAVPGMP